ncbi:MAG: MbcA/ParS/Xre antitoxin family protein [Cellvibrionales bacterium]|nr:MbcA/ParS/Xre antitoxin family protein [Cellvibrionales bacterium]
MHQPIRTGKEMGQLGIPKDVFNDHLTYIRTVRAGVSGASLKKIIQRFGHREAFIDALGTTSSNFSRLYARKSLEKNQSESILEFVRIFNKAEEVFGDQEHAELWLGSNITALGGETPMALFDTFEGRKLVMDALQKVAFGEFS